MLIRDIEIEMNICILGRLYIGKKALKKNLFFPEALPLFATQSTQSTKSKES